MSLQLFFDPIPLPDNLSTYRVHPTLFYNHLSAYHDTFPQIEGKHIALIGVSGKQSSGLHPADEVRKKLYILQKNSGIPSIADLGNLRRGENDETTCERLAEVCHTLMQMHVLPVIIGGPHELDYAQFLAYRDSSSYVNMLIIDAFIDISGNTSEPSHNHIHKILLHQPNLIFNYSHLGYQQYLVPEEYVNTLDKLYFEAYRVGQIRDNIKEMEPIVRYADFMSFDICAIKRADAPANPTAQPFGLTGEEACMLCWYAGINSKLSSAGFYEYIPELDERSQTAGVLATMIWYFIEGYYNRKEVHDINHPSFLKYIVSMDKDPAHIVFYKHTASDMWWMEVPYPPDKKKYAQHCLVPCSYNDYLAAGKGEVPYRWIQTQAKLL
ncbi:MAG: formimidoylglutamase [Cytophagaceae bacterium]|nr:formimidoylglutamase [Cytophagaceae bacterium]MDW8456608.1 formimidoylglutamase [Cytophagaceae bacterium]